MNPTSSQSADLKFEIGHVLFIDIVGYSKLRIDEQKEWLRKLTDIVLATTQVREATNEQLVRLPTGDGMALVFRNSSEEPVRCALEIAEAVQKNTGSTETPQLRLRMGVHSGPVSEVNDVSGRTNIAGAGINMAQRVMDCGDAGHILLSKHVADDLEHYPRWQPYLHSLGECEVKHGVRLGVVNLYNHEVGNPQLPNKFRALAQRRSCARWSAIAITLLLLSGVIAASIVISRKSATRSSTVPGKSIAVLPFVNMSADKNDEYLSDGMTEELINVLAKVPGLRVPGRTSCFAFKGKNEEGIFREVGQQLHVGTVLEGSVRKAGDKLRVTAQLVKVADGFHLWSEDYDGDLADILRFESNVAKSVVDALQVKLGVKDNQALEKKPTENTEAYRLYLLGRYEIAKFSQSGWNNAINDFKQSLQIDPQFALAYSGIADTYGFMGGEVMPGREAWSKTKEFAQKSLALDPSLPEAHLSLAIGLISSFDWKQGQAELDRAVALNPNLPYQYDAQAWVFTAFGHFDEAIAKEKRALVLDPLNPFFQNGLGWYLYNARRYDEAIAQFHKALEIDPTGAANHNMLGLSYAAKHDLANAITEFEKAKQLDNLADYDGSIAYYYGVSGNRAQAEQVIARLTQLSAKSYVPASALQKAYLGLGDNRKALDWLEKSCENQEPICWWLKVDPIYDPLRNEPRFQAIVKKVGLDQ